MDGGFNDRVNKVFASISSSSSSSSSSSAWSLTNAQVERREWKRGRSTERDDSQIPVSSSFQDQDDTNNNNNWGNIRSSIGLDSTLDNEEEEDAYDQMAQGWENGGHRLYMKEVNDHGHYLNSHNVLPKSFHDPRANHDAAKTRLKEDDADDEPMLNAEDAAIKSILKRKTRDEVAKPAKRVRFNSTCKDKDANAAHPHPHPTRVSGNGRSVPDYILNPSKYTRYTLDDSEAYLETSPQHDEKSCGQLLPKSVVFIPRKKSGGNSSVKQSSTQACSTTGIGIASVEGEEIKEDDDAVCTKAKCQKPVRQYRSKMEGYEDVS